MVPHSAGKGNDRWPLRFRLLITAAFGCFAAIGAGAATCDGDLGLRIKFGCLGLACALAVIGLWVPLGRWSQSVAEMLRSLL